MAVAEIQGAAAAIQALPVVDRASLVALVERTPNAIPVLGLVVGLSREQLRGFLRHRFGTASWSVVAKSDPAGVVRALDEEFSLVDEVVGQRERIWTRTYESGTGRLDTSMKRQRHWGVDVLRPWFGPDVMQRERELAARAEAARRRRQRPAEDTAAGRTGEQVIAEAEAILGSVEVNGSEACRDEAGAA